MSLTRRSSLRGMSPPPAPSQSVCVVGQIIKLYEKGFTLDEMNEFLIMQEGGGPFRIAEVVDTLEEGTGMDLHKGDLVAVPRAAQRGWASVVDMTGKRGSFPLECLSRDGVVETEETETAPLPPRMRSRITSTPALGAAVATPTVRLDSRRVSFARVDVDPDARRKLTPPHTMGSSHVLSKVQDRRMSLASRVRQSLSRVEQDLMKELSAADVADLEQRILAVGNIAVFKASTFAVLLGLMGVFGLVAAMAMGMLEGFHVAAFICFMGAALSWGLREAARRGMIRGRQAFVAFGIYVNLPTMLHLLSHVYMPDGAATFLFGPLRDLYPLIVLVAAFTFNAQLCLSTAICAAVGFCFSGYLASPHLHKLSGWSITAMQDLTDPMMWANRFLVLAMMGPTAAALATFGRHLAMVAVGEARNRDQVHRLFGEYVSTEVADRLLCDHRGLVSERRDTVLLFCDIRGFTTYSESADPEEVVTRLNQWFEVAVEACQRRGGVVDKFIGDCIMVTFDGVVKLDDASQCAVDAAIDMLAGLEQLNAEWAVQGRPAFEVGIGLHRGELLIGSIGSHSRKDFTVIGDTVNTASRIEGLTKKFGCPLLVSEAVVKELADGSPFELLATASVAGRTSKVAIYAPRPAILNIMVAMSAAQLLHQRDDQGPLADKKTV